MKGPVGEILDQTGDGGDSCNFTCTREFFTGSFGHWDLFIGCGGPVRHPADKPWDNPKNFTIDQAVPLIAVAHPGWVKYFYFPKHWLFAPNTERDQPGSKKMKWPHSFFKDSLLTKGDVAMIDTTTMPMKFNWKRFRFENVLYSNFDHTIETKLFDNADLVQPDFFGMMVLRGQIKWLYPVLPFCYLWCAMSILSHCFIYARSKEGNDFKQLFIMGTFYRLEKMFLRLHPYGLIEASRIYFIERRNLPELHDAFVGYLKKRGLYGLGFKN